MQFCGKVETINLDTGKVEFQIPLDGTKKRKLEVFVIRNLQKLIIHLPLGSKLSGGDESGVLVGPAHSIHRKSDLMLSSHLMTIPILKKDMDKFNQAYDEDSFLCFIRDGRNSTITIRHDTFN